MDVQPFLNQIQDRTVQRFETRGRLKTFQQFLEDFVDNPRRHLRTSPAYLCEMFEYFGDYEVDLIGTKGRRWKVFDCEFAPDTEPLVGQERVQDAIYRQLKQFAKRGRSDKMLVLHGPNGSSKTTTTECLFRGLEQFSQQPEGALYRCNWVFTEREDRFGEPIGFEHELGDSPQPDSYALLKPEEISVRIPCELRDTPLFLIPREERERFIEHVLEQHRDRTGECDDFNYAYFLNGDLSPKSKKIYEALLTAYHGNWIDVIRHVQVERYFISKRFRQGAISVEPQANIDAESRPISYEPSVQLPPLLQNLGLMEAAGELISANHGMLEFSDFLKRPLESNKYLLTTSEKGTIHLRDYTAYLNLTLFATVNEKQLSLFKRNPDFPSFKGRMELIPVPYLLMYSREAALYQRHIDLFSRGRHVTPHTAEVAALWAVLTRLRRPSAKNYAPELAPIVARLTPLEKARLFDQGAVPLHFREEERKLLMSNIRQIRTELSEAEGEFEGIHGAEYEGRRGASAREMMSVLADAAENQRFRCLTPMAVFDELEKLTRDISVYEFLRVPSDNGYNDCVRFIEQVKEDYIETIKQEVFNSIGLVDEQEYGRVFEEYFQHVKAFDMGEKLWLSSRNQYVDPSQDLMNRIEGLLNLTESVQTFRSNLMTKIASFTIENPDKSLAYRELFPEIYHTFKQSFYKERERALQAVEQNVLTHDSDEYRFLSPEDQRQVETTLEQMCTNHAYCHHCAKDAIAFVLRHC